MLRFSNSAAAVLTARYLFIHRLFGFESARFGFRRSLHGGLAGGQFLFNIIVGQQFVKLFFQGGAVPVVDQIGLGLHPVDALLELFEAGDGLDAVRPADLLAGPAGLDGPGMALGKAALLFAGGGELFLGQVDGNDPPRTGQPRAARPRTRAGTVG